MADYDKTANSLNNLDGIVKNIYAGVKKRHRLKKRDRKDWLK
jgi:hypothetical protein